MGSKDDFVKSNYKTKTDLEIAEILEIGVRKVRNIREALKIKKRNAPHKYTEEQKLFLSENRINNNINDLANIFNDRFNLSLTPSKLGRVCRNNGYYCKLSLSELNSSVNEGDERLTGRSRTYIKTKDGFTYKNRLVYEKYHNCKLNKDDVIIFLDGNKSNFDIENLYCISRKINLMLSQNKWHSCDKNKTLTAIKWCELFYTIKQI